MELKQTCFTPYSAWRPYPPPFILSCNAPASVTCLLTMLVDLKSLGIVYWSKFQQQVFGVCDRHWAAVPQHHLTEVRTDCWVQTACLQPESRGYKKRKEHDWSDKWMDEWWRYIFLFQPGGVASVMLNLRRRLIVLTGQLVGNGVSQFSVHFPATRYCFLSIQNAVQSGKLPKVCGPRERKRANNNSCKAPDLSQTSIKLGRGKRLEMWGNEIRDWVSLRSKSHYFCKIIQYVKHANPFIHSWNWTVFLNLPSLVCQVTTGLQSLQWPMLVRALTLASYLLPGSNDCLSSVTLVFATSTVCKESEVLWVAFGIFTQVYRSIWRSYWIPCAFLFYIPGF